MCKAVQLELIWFSKETLSRLQNILYRMGAVDFVLHLLKIHSLYESITSQPVWTGETILVTISLSIKGD